MVNAKNTLLFCVLATLVLAPGCVGEKQEPQPKAIVKKTEKKQEKKQEIKKGDTKKSQKQVQKQEKQTKPTVNRSVQEVETMDEYYEIINNGNKSLIFAHSHSCPPCIQTEPEVQKAAKKYGHKINFVSILTSNNALDKALDDLDVQSIPTIVFFDKNGNEVHRNVGALNDAQIGQLIESKLQVKP